MTCKRLVALTLALLCLTSCASMLNREVTYTAEHVENPPASLADAYRVNTYMGLYSALCSYVEEGMREGNLRFPATYPGNLTVDLEKAKRQLMEEHPLGCYAVEDVTFHVNRIIAYYEVSATFDYRVSPQEYMTIETVRDDNGLDALMETALEDFGERLTLLLERPAATTTALDDSLRRVYDFRPDLALGYPELKVTYYPESGTQAVAEMTIVYPESVTVLRLRQRNLLRRARELADEMGDNDPLAIRSALLARCAYDPEGGGTAADALLDGRASDEGLARAFDLLCRLKEIETFGVTQDEEGYRCMIGGDDSLVIISFKPDEAPSSMTNVALHREEEETP